MTEQQVRDLLLETTRDRDLYVRQHHGTNTEIVFDPELAYMDGEIKALENVLFANSLVRA